MKILSSVLIFSVSLMLFGCGKGNEVNGRSLKTANKSVSYIKDRLPADQRIEFEVSFWMLRDDIRDNKAFLSAVDGKTPEALIEMGKELFAKRKASGFKEYDSFATWDQMIANFSQERLDQNRKGKSDPRDKQNNVLYKL